RTKLLVSRSGMSTRLLEVVSEQGMLEILQSAYQGGINYYEIPCSASSCASGVGKVFYDKRKDVVIGITCELSENRNITNVIDNCLENLIMDYIDIFTVKSNEKVFMPKDEDDVYAALMTAKSQGKFHFIGFYTHNLKLAQEAARSGLYDIIQYPINIFSTDEELELVSLCEELDIGLVARMPFDGGKIENVPLAYGFLRQFETLVPVYNVKNLDELQKLIYFESNPPIFDDKFAEDLSNLRKSANK
nr:aldo/keto reductase [Treponemataceae bacterium]